MSEFNIDDRAEKMAEYLDVSDNKSIEYIKDNLTLAFASGEISALKGSINRMAGDSNE